MERECGRRDEGCECGDDEGEGDAQALKIYAEAFEKDPEFYSFTRSIEAYRRSLGTSNDLLVLDSESDFFRFLKKSEGK